MKLAKEWGTQRDDKWVPGLKPGFWRVGGFRGLKATAFSGSRLREGPWLRSETWGTRFVMLWVCMTQRVSTRAFARMPRQPDQRGKWIVIP